MEKMVKRISVLSVSLGLLLLGGVSGCNRGIVDLNFKYTYAEVSLPGGRTMKGRISTWWDYDNSDSVQIKFDNGRVVYTHLSNVVLFDKEPK